jgi:hypothetical protein
MKWRAWKERPARGLAGGDSRVDDLTEAGSCTRTRLGRGLATVHSFKRSERGSMAHHESLSIAR